MTGRTVDLLLDERARLVAKNAATQGDLWMSELLLRRASRYLTEFIAPTPALSAARDTLVQEIAELLAEEGREHPAADVALPDHLDSATGPVGEGEDPAGPVAG